MGASVLALIVGVGVLSLTQPPSRVAVLVAAEALPAGAVISEASLREAEVEPLEGLVRADERATLDEWILDVPVPAGAPLTHAMLSPPSGSSPDLLAVTLEAEHAVQGRLAPGDLVDIYVTDDEGARLLASTIQVVSVEVGAGGLDGSDVAVLLAVDDTLALDLIAAMRLAVLDLVRVSR
jgi:Flp pilus assembly protein CpaB